MKTLSPLFVAALVGPLGVVADCSHNNCLRAVIAQAFPTRNGTADCEAYLRTTVTPPVSTIVKTVTVPTVVFVSSTEVDVVTQVETVVAATETSVDEETATVEETLTLVNTVTATQTVQAGNGGAPTAIPVVPRKAKRCVPRPFPKYASACSSLPAYISACSCVGIFPGTTTVAAPSTTITVTETSTIESTVVETTSTTATVQVSVTETSLVTIIKTITTTNATATLTTTVTTVVTTTPDPNIVKNGGFETGSLSPWELTYDNIAANIVKPGSGGSVYSLKTGNMHDNTLFELYQVLASVPGQEYSCSYDWKYSNYYETKYSDGNTYVPYVHVYVNDEIYSNRRPDSNTMNQWQTSSFTFTAEGGDTLYFDCASPQSPGGKKGGSNYLWLDNVVCVPVV